MEPCPAHVILCAGGKQHPLERCETPPGRVVRGNQEVPEELAAVALAIAVDGRIDPRGRRRGFECLRQLLGEPFRRLKCPSTADSPQRVGGHRRVAHEGDPGPTGRPHGVRHIELADDL